MKQNQSYTAEFRTEAVRMVFEQGLSQAEVAARLGVPKRSLANWVDNPPIFDRHQKESDQAVMAYRCLGVMPPSAMCGRS